MTVEDDEDPLESDEEDDIDWETIQLPPRFDPSQASTEETYKDVEIVMEAPLPVLKKPKKSNWRIVYERNLRDWTHNAHIVLLIAHYSLRNSWCSRDETMSVLASITPDHAKTLLSKDSTQENLIRGIKWLLTWWHTYFTISGPGLFTIPATESPAQEPYIHTFEDFLQLRSGTRDTSAQLFVALLRSCGCETRLVCSLQPVSYKPPVIKRISTTDDDDDDPDLATVTNFEFKAPFKPYIDPDHQWKQPKAKPPIIWAEVYCKQTQTWICVDPIRAHVNKPGLMEPLSLDRHNHLSFILAFEKNSGKRRGNIVDVTKRYTRNMMKALKERERPLSMREKQAGERLWSDTFLGHLSRKNTLNERDLLEQEELQLLEVDDVMPTSIGAFKNHPLYALERHLKRMEILYEKEPVLGYIKGEKVYARQCVRSLSTADTFRRAGREIMEGEQPLKMVKAQGSTINTKRLQERAKGEGNELLVPCYGEWQTRLYVPPPLVNGKIIKNAFNNIDLFKPTMLPKGAAHIPIKGIARMARKFGIDYAEAVVDFEFKKLKAVPVMDGIVIAQENKQILLEAWEEYEQTEARKAIAKQEKETLLRWRKLIKGLIIKARVDTEYSQDVWDGYDNDGDAPGGFLPEEE
ncbi:uncharacterized protein EV154DRAFT_419888 [Mucor mucedo]|uniref:uncharacterized protein n=1 Tax=Mucor mucedo TaxID=29922 RepID=UPI00221E6B7A|nr:uncharacterized protein EV154DRAFT_419888 [Mucor mucedo]KAI7891812.1 hypothetical protein EV154DRAFT_419888 [Mucor mucedo]